MGVAPPQRVLVAQPALAAQAHARACSALGVPELADALCLLNVEATDALPELLDAVCAPFCSAFFPRRAPSPCAVCRVHCWRNLTEWLCSTSGIMRSLLLHKLLFPGRWLLAAMCGPRKALPACSRWSFNPTLLFSSMGRAAPPPNPGRCG